MVLEKDLLEKDLWSWVVGAKGVRDLRAVNRCRAMRIMTVYERAERVASGALQGMAR